MSDAAGSASRIMVTGGGGFLGRSVARLESVGAARLYVPRSADHDLRTRTGIEAAIAEGEPEVVIHLAAVVGGIGANRENPGRFFYDNAIMGIAAHGARPAAGVEQVRDRRDRLLLSEVHAGPVPRGRPVGRLPGRDERAVRPGQEDAARPGPGLSPAVRLRRDLPDPGQPVRAGRQLRPGQLARHPGADQEDDRCPRRRRRHIDVWGTGCASREFLYVDDAAEGIVLGALRYEGAEPVNLGVGHEITIRELTEPIVALTGFGGEIRWDPTKPDGQPRRALDTSRAREAFGFEARTKFEEGLARTVEWYRSNRAARLPLI